MAPTRNNSRARNWVFTWNNPGEGSKEEVLNIDCRYVIFQLEKGESGTPHYQGTIVFNNTKRFSAVKNLLPHCHIEPCASLSDSIEYCSKEEGREEGPWEKGTKPSQGKRTDLDDVANYVKSGKNLKEVAETYPVQFIKFHKGIAALINQTSPKREWVMDVNVYTGSTGTGKTRAAYDATNDPYVKPAGDWWDGYVGQEDVIIDDFACDMPITQLLRVLDRYPLKVPIKGGFVEFVAKAVYITSNIPYEEWYPNARAEHKEALTRRITLFKVFE